MKVPKKANAPEIARVAKRLHKDLPKSISWEGLWKELADLYGLELGIYTHCKTNGDDTCLTVDMGSRTILELVEPNSAVFLPDIGDWEWSYIYRLLVRSVLGLKKKDLTFKKTKKGAP